MKPLRLVSHDITKNYNQDQGSNPHKFIFGSWIIFGFSLHCQLLKANLATSTKSAEANLVVMLVFLFATLIHHQRFY